MVSGFETLGAVQELVIDDFRGGLNLSASPTSLDPSETPNALNVTITERGSIMARLGFRKWNEDETPPSGVGVSGYYSELLGKTLWQFGTDVYLQDGSGDMGSAVITWSDSSPCAFVDFAGKVYAVHPTDGLKNSTDGASWSDVATGPHGSTIAVWQNKLWIAGDPSQPTRVHFSAIGDGGTWSGSGAGTIDLREVNDAPITALHPAPTEGLLAYKEEAAHRIGDSTTGAYQTISNKYGATNHRAVVTLFGRTYSACSQGVFVTDGLTALQTVTEKVKLMFTPEFLALDKLANWAMGWKGTRVYLSLTRNGASANDLTLEIHALQNWVMAHDCAASCFVQYSDEDEKLLGASPTVEGQTYEFFAGGSDDGTPITARYQTGWIKPRAFVEISALRLLVRGWGLVDCHIRRNQDPSEGDLQTLDMRTDSGLTGFLWGTSKYDGGHVWGPVPDFAVEADASIYTMGTCRDISWEFSMTTDDTAQRPGILGYSEAETVAPWGVVALHFFFTPLGQS